MQTLNQGKTSNKKIKKSHLLIIGSLLVFFGGIILFSNHLLTIRESVYSDMMLLISDSMSDENIITDIPEVEILPNDEVASNEENNIINSSSQENNQPPAVDYDKYLGVLEIPRISLKRGFYGIDSPYNDIKYNVSVVNGSLMPDVDRGNLILMAHSGDAYISYFAYLYKLKIGSDIYVTYNKVKYHYKLVNIYDVPKDGSVTIIRNYDKTTLTLITCTKDDSAKQTVYIAEMV